MTKIHNFLRVERVKGKGVRVLTRGARHWRWSRCVFDDDDDGDEPGQVWDKDILEEKNGSRYQLKAVGWDGWEEDLGSKWSGMKLEIEIDNRTEGKPRVSGFRITFLVSAL